VLHDPKLLQPAIVSPPALTKATSDIPDGDNAKLDGRRKSRGESMDITISTPESVAASEAQHIGAVRFVHLTRNRVVIAASDQGHIAAWQPWQKDQRPPVQPATIQGDIFATAVGAKARRDAKNKYTAKSAENKFVYFKIHAATQKSAAAAVEEPFELWDYGLLHDLKETGPPTEASTSPNSRTASMHDSEASDAEADLSEDSFSSSSWRLDADEHLKASRRSPKLGRRSSNSASRLLIDEDRLSSDASSVAGGEGEASKSKGRSRWTEEDRLKLEAREAKRRQKAQAARAVLPKPTAQVHSLSGVLLNSATAVVDFEVSAHAAGTPGQEINLHVELPAIPLAQPARRSSARNPEGLDSHKSTETSPVLKPETVKLSPALLPLAGPRARPRGSRLRSDIWCAHQWVKQEPFATYEESSPEGRGAVKMPNTGACYTFRSLLAFPDGDIAVTCPASISKSTGAVWRVDTLQPEGRVIRESVVQLAPPQGARKGSAQHVPLWTPNKVAWLERPPSEERSRVSAAACSPGMVQLSGWNAVTPEPDVIVAAFARVVGLWLYLPEANGPAISDADIHPEAPKLTRMPSGAEKRLPPSDSAPAQASRDVDSRIMPHDIIRVHLHPVTAVAVWRMHPPPPCAVAAQLSADIRSIW
jgi:hypothetical protein